MYIPNRGMPTTRNAMPWRTPIPTRFRWKEKSNDGKYLKYRPKHSFKATLDFQWKRINIGANVNWKSKILAVDYIMLDERSKSEPDLLDYVRGILFGSSNGETLASLLEKA